ncbi:hypothetical protein LTR36_002215 [Oleoguttula mirabilis]|uniref:Methyltransferase type 11 domain-containing protein n=1 Tax=Oleoguttula mirabilis TaxID=1507867 RepID=A0AAV9JLB3_9PEZI|nr:hypothetical protein LTR36_002215 [Oleoguttula mirabilis]
MASTSSTVLDTNPPALRVVATNEKITGVPAREMLRRSGISSSGTSELHVLDNACGGGILAHEVLRLARQHPDSMKLDRLVAGDIDEKMLSYVRNRQADAGVAMHESWQKVEIMKIDQQSIPLPDKSFTHLFSNFGIFFCQDDEKAVSEAFRVLKSGGTVGFTTWKDVAWWSEIALPALAQLIPEAPTLPPPDQMFPQRGWSDLEAITAKLEKAGFEEIKVSEFSFTPDVDADEFAEGTAILTKVVAKKGWSGEQNIAFADQIEPALLRYLKENFKDGKWNGKMTAIITLGKKA